MRAEKDQTCSQTIRKRRYSTEIKEGYIRLFWRIVLIVAVGWLLFTQVFLIGQAPDNEMFPAVEAGDLLIGFRMEQNFAKNDVVVYEAGGKTHVGRILGCETDVITMDRHRNASRKLERPRQEKLHFLHMQRRGSPIPTQFRKAVCSFWEITGHRQKTAVNSAPSPQRM